MAQSEIIIDRPRGTRHPRHPDILYQVDYGFLKNTVSMDGGGIDVWRGSLPAPAVDGLICTIDLLKRDSEIKLLGCTADEIETVYRFHNEHPGMKGLLCLRPETRNRLQEREEKS